MFQHFTTSPTTKLEKETFLSLFLSLSVLFCCLLLLFLSRAQTFSFYSFCMHVTCASEKSFALWYIYHHILSLSLLTLSVFFFTFFSLFIFSHSSLLVYIFIFIYIFSSLLHPYSYQV